MRLLRKNMTEIIVNEFVSKDKIYDDNGLFTGEYQSTYTTSSALATVIAGNSRQIIDIFGIDEDIELLMYTKSVYEPNTLFEINWLGKQKMFRIHKPKPSLDHVVYGLKLVV